MSESVKRGFKRIQIVLEENDGGFAMKLEGDVERLLNGTPVEKLSPVEQYGKRMFDVCGQVLKQDGAKKQMLRPPNANPYAGGRR